jgi:hypothetical protein
MLAPRRDSWPADVEGWGQIGASLGRAPNHGPLYRRTVTVRHWAPGPERSRCTSEPRRIRESFRGSQQVIELLMPEGGFLDA